MELYEIYLITNKINNKKYVGQTKNSTGYLKRFEQHCLESKYSRHSSALHNAINKYGKENFSVKRLLKNIPENRVDFYESLWIKKLNTHIKYSKGYNMTYGGQGIHGYKHTSETLNKISESSKEYWNILKNSNLKEYNRLCKLRSLRMKGKPKPEIHRKHLSEAAKKRFKNSAGTFKGKHHSEATKNKISEQNGHSVIMIDKQSLEPLKTFVSAAKAAQWLIENNKTTNKYANARILKICNGEDKSAYGYYWKYLKEV